MEKKYFCKKCVILIIGLFLEAFGVVLSIRANLGVTPISSIPYIFSLKFADSTVGVWTLAVNGVFLIIQLLLLKKDFKKRFWLQVPILVLFCFFLDSLNFLTKSIRVSNYVQSLSLIVLGTIFLALGITLCCAADICMNTGEAVVSAISSVTKIEFGKVKIMFDATLVVLTILISLYFFNTLRAVREGTVIMAVFTGVFVQIFTKAAYRFCTAASSE